MANLEVVHRDEITLREGLHLDTLSNKSTHILTRINYKQMGKFSPCGIFLSGICSFSIRLKGIQNIIQIRVLLQDSNQLAFIQEMSGGLLHSYSL